MDESSTAGRALVRITLPLISTLAALSLAAPASAVTFTVNSTGDAADSNPGNGTCATSASVCTLRAAINEANALSGTDDVQFSSAFDGTMATSAITVSSGLSVTAPLTINAAQCVENATKPCAEVRANSGGLAISVTSSGVTLRGLAVDGLQVSVQGPAGVPQTGIVIKGNWFGSNLDGTTDGDVFNRLLIGGNVSGATIGGTTPQDRNLFNGSGQSAINVFGDDTVIAGNWIGVRPDGTVASSAVWALMLGGFGSGGPVPERTLIGGPDTGTPTGVESGTTEKCDGPCNLLNGNLQMWGGFGLSGVDSTSIEGNFISGSITNTGATRTTLGGPDAVDRNYIGQGVGANPGLVVSDASMSIQNNWFGLDPSGTTASAFGGINTSGQIVGNRFAAPQNKVVAAPITLRGGFASVVGNTFGLGINGEDLGYSDHAITISGGNHTIGGRLQTDQNVFANGDGDPIEISGGNTQVLPNRGAGNQGAMVDLVGPQGPGVQQGGGNGAAPAPTIDSATTSQVSGHIPPCPNSSFCVEGYAEIFVYRVTATEFTPVAQGTTSIDGSGTFNIGLAGVSDGDCLAATSADYTFRGTSELSSPAIVGAGTCDLTPPTTVVTSGPAPTNTGSRASAPAAAALSSDTTYRFTFSSEPGAGFQCKLDISRWRACSGANSDSGLVPLDDSEHIFRVRAVDRAGNVDADPPTIKFTGNQAAATRTPEPSPSGATCAGVPATEIGTPGADTLRGTRGADVIVARGGNDRVRALAGPDVVCGGAGKDKLRGRAGGDILLGQGGNDILAGGGGDDRLGGGPGRDSCSGGLGRNSQRSCA